MKTNFCKQGLAALVIAVACSTSALADTKVNAGLLTCNVEGKAGFIIGSSKDMACTYESTDGSIETYNGTIKKFGIDIGETESTTVKWVVLGPAKVLEPRTLEGSYGGLSAEASVGYGAGANAMIGGSSDAVVLQPFSGQVQRGLNIALGIGTMTLR